MIEPITEELPFLGARTYLQGTTLLSCLVRYMPADASFSFKVPRFIRTPRITISVSKQGDEAPEKWDAMLKWEKKGDTGVVYANAIPFEGEPVRVPFDESKVVSLAEFSKSEVLLSKESPYEFVTTIVSLNKAFLLRNVQGLGQGQWVFTRLDMTSLPDSSIGLRIVFEVGLQGTRITKSGVWIDDARLGELYFAWIMNP